MAFEKVATLSDLRPGQLLLVHAQHQNICLANIDGDVCAVANECTHVGAPLNQGSLQDGEVRCPRHGSRFNVRTGEVTEGPATKAVKAYAVMVEGEDVYIDAG